VRGALAADVPAVVAPELAGRWSGAIAWRGQGNGRTGELVQCLRMNRTTSTMITMTTMTPKLINMGYSSRYLRVSQR
jgi:hypothetical protein